MIKFRTMLAGTSTVAVALAGATVANAQATTTPGGNAATQYQSSNEGGVQDIVVTAERHSVNLQKAPLSIDVLSAASLEGSAVTSYSDALQQTNNVVVQGTTNTDSPTPTIAIRGLGTDGGSRVQATAVYVDGVIVNNGNLQFYDLSRVEVLSGPQATLYGGVATAGAVNIITNDPSVTKLAADAKIAYGSFNTLTYGGVLNVPVSNDLAIRAAVNGQRRDNYFGNSGDGRSEINARLKVLYKPSDAISVMLGAELYHFNGNIGEALSVEDPIGNLSKPLPLLGGGNINDYKVYANINWRLGWANVTSITAFQASDTHVYYQGVPHVAPVVGFGPNGPVFAASPVFTTGSNNTPYQDQFTEELRLSSNPGSALTWVAGMYFQRSAEKKTNGSDSSGSIPLTSPPPVIFFQTIDITQYHPFAQATYTVVPGVRLTGGISYDSYENNYPQVISGTGGPGSVAVYPYDQTFHSLDGVGRIEGDLSAHNLVYGSFSTGFRPGGPGGGAPSQWYGVERVKAFEIGSKNRFLDNKLQVNAAAYYYNFPAFQNQTNTIVGGVIEQAVVAVPAKLYGLELSIEARLTSADTLTLKGAYEHGRYAGNISYTSNSGTTYGVLTDGARMTHAPTWNLNADYNHRFDFADGSKLEFDGNMRYTSSQLISFDECAFNSQVCGAESSPFTGFIYQSQYIQKAYTLFNASATYTSSDGRYSVTAYGRNLGNLLYKTNTQFGLANPGDPRTYGVQLAVKF